MRCQGICKTGEQCRRNVKPGAEFCGLHLSQSPTAASTSGTVLPVANIPRRVSSTRSPAASTSGTVSPAANIPRRVPSTRSPAASTSRCSPTTSPNVEFDERVAQVEEILRRCGRPTSREIIVSVLG